MITHQGVAYWTTQELANSLAARGLIRAGGTTREQKRRARRWAERADLRPDAITRTGGMLWGQEAALAAMEADTLG